eukprot:scaffold4559_cov50-Attheya_sp.AAC.3
MTPVRAGHETANPAGWCPQTLDLLPGLTTTQILDTCPPDFRDALKCGDLDSAWQAVATAKVDESVRASTAWKSLREFTTEIGRDLYLRRESKPLKQQALMGFAAQVRTGIFGHKKQIGGQSVDTQSSVLWRKPSFWPDTMIPDAPTDQMTSTSPSDTC